MLQHVNTGSEAIRSHCKYTFICICGWRLLSFIDPFNCHSLSSVAVIWLHVHAYERQAVISLSRKQTRPKSCRECIWIKWIPVHHWNNLQLEAVSNLCVEQDKGNFSEYSGYLQRLTALYSSLNLCSFWPLLVFVSGPKQCYHNLGITVLEEK